MSNAGSPAKTRILAVRLGAMGDLIHTLPAVASLKHSFPGSRLTWAVEARWAGLLEGNPFVDRVAVVSRESPRAILESLSGLRSERYDLAVDFQGLLKSAAVASLARAERIFGFEYSQLRERSAGLFYSDRAASASAHIVDRTWTLPPPPGLRARCGPFRFRPENRKETCRRAISSWPRHWPDGNPSSGRPVIIARWPLGCEPNCASRSCSTCRPAPRSRRFPKRWSTLPDCPD